MERRVELVDLRDSAQETNWAENTLGYVSKIPAYGRNNHKSAFRGWVLQEYAIELNAYAIDWVVSWHLRMQMRCRQFT